MVILTHARKKRKGANKGRVFSALFLALDEAGRVVTFCMTPTKSMDDVEGHLDEVKQRSGVPVVIFSGNSC